jgi:outer membrane protein OmpA-like peptidoglycan-associated protein/uncharacterized protein YidB (DUF937 family)
MAILDSIVSEAASRFGLGDKAAPLVSGLLSMMTSEQSGGLMGFIDKFRQGGLGDLVSSWISTGDNRPITENQLERVLGANVINNLAAKAGISSSLASTALAFIVPRVINFLTPNGTVPTSIPASVTSFLSGVGGMRETAAAAASGGRSGLWKVLPLLLLAVVGLLGYRYCSAVPGTENASTALSNVSPSPIIPSINSTLSLTNEAGKIKFSGVVPDEATKQKILDQLKAAFGEGSYIGDIRVDPSAKPITWLGNLGDALKAFNVPGAELSFDGDAIKVGGEIAADLKNKLLDSLKSIFGAGFDLSAINLDVAAMTKDAAAKTMAALGSLTGSSSAAELVKALNLNLINFASGSSAIPADQAGLLKKSAGAIKAAAAGTKLEVGGYTDNKGDSAANLKLSQARADAVRAFLIKQGVKADMLTAKGYGDANPTASNDTAEGRVKNRRIEFSVVN